MKILIQKKKFFFNLSNNANKYSYFQKIPTHPQIKLSKIHLIFLIRKMIIPLIIILQVRFQMIL